MPPPSEKAAAALPLSHLSPPRGFLLRCLLFLILIALPATFLLERIQSFFLNNPILNGLILFVLAIGILHTLYQILRLTPEVAWANEAARRRMRREDAPPQSRSTPRPILLAPLARLFSREETAAIPTAAARFLLDSIAARLEEARGVSRYLIGLLVFLGLLGTFWGLLETISAIGDVVRSLDAADADALTAFAQLRAGLEAPLAGMGTAFSSSLFGLGGSLILGFLDLQAGQAQGRFHIELEEFISAMTSMEETQSAAAAGETAVGSEGENQAHILEDIRRLLMVAEGERALAGRALEAIAASLRRLEGNSLSSKDEEPDDETPDDEAADSPPSQDAKSPRAGSTRRRP